MKASFRRPSKANQGRKLKVMCRHALRGRKARIRGKSNTKPKRIHKPHGESSLPHPPSELRNIQTQASASYPPLPTHPHNFHSLSFSFSCTAPGSEACVIPWFPAATPWGGSGAMRRRRQQRRRLRRGRCRRSGASALRRTIPDPSVAGTITATSTGGVAVERPEETLWRDD